MKEIKVVKRNESKLFLECDSIISKEIWNWFSARTPNYKFDPRVKAGIWDGYLHFFDLKNNLLPIGLIDELYVFARKGGYKVIYQFVKNPITEKELEDFIDTLNLPENFEVRDYQFKAAYDAITKCKLNIKSVTSSGKSLILYIIIRYLESINKKIILVVPNILLVEQMYSDFDSYGWEYVADKCHMIYGGQKKVFDCPILISTWQSLYKDKELFQIFDCLIIDEAHLASGKSLSDISSNCINAKWKIGCSGTYPVYHTVDWFSIVGSLGQIGEYSTYKKLQDDGHIAKLKIYNMELNYPKEFKFEVFTKAGKDFHLESDLVNGNEIRQKFILKMAQNFNGNALILFTKIEKHGVPLLKILKENLVDKQVYFIDGSVDVLERDKIRKIMETRNDIILLASYGTFSIGASVKNIHHVVFASGYKSQVKVLQSIGRGLRKSEFKDSVTLYDIYDNLKCKIDGKVYENFSVKHHKDRLQIYANEGFQSKTIKFDMK